MADEYRAQLLAVEARLAKEPDNEELLSLKQMLEEVLEELADETTEEKEPERTGPTSHDKKAASRQYSQPAHSSSTYCDNDDQKTDRSPPMSRQGLVSGDKGSAFDSKGEASGQRRQLTEAEILAKKREKNKKKKAKLREKYREQLDTAETVKQTWQSFANQKGLKGLTKKSIFASPSSFTGKVGVGTNGIADAPASGGRNGGPSSLSSAPTSSAPITRRHRH